MSEERVQRRLRFSQSDERSEYPSDYDDHQVAFKRRKFVYQEEEEESRMPRLGVNPFSEREEEEEEEGSGTRELAYVAGEESETGGLGVNSSVEEEEESGTRELVVNSQNRLELGVNSFTGGEEEESREEEMLELGGGVFSYGEDMEENGYSVGNSEEMSSSSSNKWIQENPVDRLSELPDLLLIHILSFLDMREAVATAVLSRRWQFLWTDMPNLIFLDRGDQEKGEFLAWVSKNLLICSGNHLQKFTVCFDYNKSFAFDVNAWVQFALKNKVKEVALLLNAWEDWFMLPQMMYSNSSLTCLSLSGCIMEPRRTIEWGSLTTLYLDDMELREDVIGKILSGCPVLYDLSVTECWGLNYLEIVCENLRALTIENWNDMNEGSFLEISAPYIDSLRISLKLEGAKLRVENISPLVRANIDFDVFDCAAEYVKVKNYTNELFEGLRHVKNLEVRDGFIEVLSMLTVKGWWLPQSEREHLAINASRDEESFPGILSLLESSPKLETLVIHGYFGRSSKACFPDGPPTSYLKKEVLNIFLFHLKTVTITNFAEPCLDGEPMLTLVKLLLKRATVLEKMVLDFTEFTKTISFLDEYITMAETLISYPRSSPKALVLLTR